MRGFGNAGIRFAGCVTGCALESVMVTETAADGVTVLFAGTADLTFRNVDLLRNGNEGFDVVGGVAHLTIDHSRVAGNAGAGVEGPTKSTLTNIRISSNGAPGVSCAECAMGDCQFWDNAGSDVVAQFAIGALRDMGGNVCDDGTCP